MYRYNASDKSSSFFVRPSRPQGSAGIVQRFCDTLLTWADRARQRRRLAQLDDYLLRDIGVSRAEVEAETSLPIWRSVK